MEHGNHVVCGVTGEAGGVVQRGLTGRNLRALLVRLDADEGEAAQQYERLRRKLIRYFSGRGYPKGEDLADAVFDRLGQRVAAGEVVHNLQAYAFGIARVVGIDSERRRCRRLRLLRCALPSLAPHMRVESIVTGVDCIRSCAAHLRAEDRQMLLEYYQEDGQSARLGRRALAARCGLTQGALRLRVFRIRTRVHLCAKPCLRRLDRKGAATS